MDPVMSPARMDEPNSATAATQTVQYASFGKRFLAFIIDAILIWVVQMILSMILIGGSMAGMSRNDIQHGVMAGAFIGSMMVLWVVTIAIQWLYFALMESSANQGTLGKMAMGIRVTDMNGNRISFGRATGRYFSKILSGIILLIGYIMAAFTERKQALHDMIASTLVLSKASVVNAQVAQNAFSQNPSAA